MFPVSVVPVAYIVADASQRGTRKVPGHMLLDLGLYGLLGVEAKGLEPSNLLTASHIFGVRESSPEDITGSLPGSIVQGCSGPFIRIWLRCLHGCLHFGGPIGWWSHQNRPGSPDHGQNAHQQGEGGGW
jgi:hypothetical protein